jgi:hypothetical protein
MSECDLTGDCGGIVVGNAKEHRIERATNLHPPLFGTIFDVPFQVDIANIAYRWALAFARCWPIYAPLPFSLNRWVGTVIAALPEHFPLRNGRVIGHRWPPPQFHLPHSFVDRAFVSIGPGSSGHGRSEAQPRMIFKCHVLPRQEHTSCACVKSHNWQRGQRRFFLEGEIFGVTFSSTSKKATPKS